MHLFQALAPIVKGSENSFYQFLGRESCQLQMLCYCIHCLFSAMKKEIKITRNQILEYDLVLKFLSSKILATIFLHNMTWYILGLTFPVIGNLILWLDWPWKTKILVIKICLIIEYCTKKHYISKYQFSIVPLRSILLESKLWKKWTNKQCSFIE